MWNSRKWGTTDEEKYPEEFIADVANPRHIRRVTANMQEAPWSYDPNTCLRCGHDHRDGPCTDCDCKVFVPDV